MSRGKRLALLGVAALVIVGGGGAAAYFHYRKPTGDAANAATLPAVTAAAARIDQFRSGGQNAVVVHPRNPNGRLVLYIHGAGQSARSLLNDPENALDTAALAKAGYTLAASDAHDRAWGTAESVDDYVQLLDRLRSEEPTSDVFVLAESMGGLDGLQLLTDPRAGHISGFAGIYPVCSLRSAHRVAALKQQIEDVYGGGLQPALGKLSPPAIGGSVPMLIWASPQDRLVPKSQNADLCVARARAGGGAADEISTRGDHGDRSNFDPARLLAFLNRAAVPAR